MADFNVRAHNSPTIQFPNNFLSPTSRLQTLSKWLYINNFHLVPTDVPSGNDHVLATNAMEYILASYSPSPQKPAVAIMVYCQLSYHHSTLD